MKRRSETSRSASHKRTSTSRSANRKLREEEETLAKAKDTIDEQVAERVKGERAKIAADEARKAKQILATDLDQKSKEITELQEILKQRDVKLEEAQKAQADLLRRQREAVRRMTSARGVEVIAGFAGSGKSAAVAAAREAWATEGYRVYGAALSGIAAENLEKASGVESRTLASWELALKEGRAQLSARDVFVIDEAGMVGSRQMERMLSKLHAAGAKAVLIGDAEQLQPIEAGAAFRAITERAGYQELTGIRRQRELWQREASREFARGEAGRALERYEAHGAIRFANTREQAKAALIGEWSNYGAAAQGAGKSTLILAHTRADVAELNRHARQILKERGELSGEIKVGTWRELIREDGSIAIEHDARAFAPGDRVMFLKNDRELGVKNGSLGTVAEVSRDSMRVMLDGKERREVAFNLRDYGAIEYGYAATVHKSQGATVDRVFVLATQGMDRHLAYVEMTRHRDQATLHAGRDDFRDFDALKQRLSRARVKVTPLDYAERRGLDTARSQGAEKEQTGRRAQAPDTRTPAMRQPERDPVQRFKQARREFIGVAGRFDLDPAAKARAAELREEMKQAAQEIAKVPARMREAEHAGIASQVKSLARQAEQGRGRERGLGKDDGLER